MRQHRSAVEDSTGRVGLSGLCGERLRGDYDIFVGHKYKPNAAEASAAAVKAGTDLTCGGNEYRVLPEAVKRGLITEAEVNASLERLFTARFKLGMFDSAERVPYSKIAYSEVDSAEHRKLALEAAKKSIVLLKNGGILPLGAGIKSIAVVGPSADDAVALMGNYNGVSSKQVTPREGIEKEFAGRAVVRYAMGAPYAAQSATTIPASALPNGLNGPLVPPVTGGYLFSGSGRPGIRIFVDEKEATAGAWVALEAGKPYAFRVESRSQTSADAELQVRWMAPDPALLAQAAEAMKSSDVTVAFVGLNPNLEGEEMRVSIPGFSGGDRTDLKLPESQQKLLETAFAKGKPVVVVLTSGSALGVGDAAAKAGSLLELWYGGEEAGTAIAQTLSGTNNPAGRLPVTFYKNVDQLPAFDDYGMDGRTYRYFKRDALYGFGFGLSYSTFRYAGLQARRTALGAEVSVRVMNTSSREGDEVAQLYLEGHLGESGLASQALRELKGFERIHLTAGESREVRFALKAGDLPKGNVTITVGGGQGVTGVSFVRGRLHS